MTERGVIKIPHYLYLDANRVSPTANDGMPLCANQQPDLCLMTANSVASTIKRDSHSDDDRTGLNAIKMPQLNLHLDANRVSPTANDEMPPCAEQQADLCLMADNSASSTANRSSHREEGPDGPSVEEAPTYHSVQGQQVQGLIYDPGAADGLVGTHTLLRYLQATGHDFKVVGAPTTTFKGIEGTGLPAHSRVNVPFGLDSEHTGFLECDTIGGTGSSCPFLLPNRACIKHKSIVISDAFRDGSSDGLMILPSVQLAGSSAKTSLGIRLLHTDSGHYIVPVATKEGPTPRMYNSLANLIYNRIEDCLGPKHSHYQMCTDDTIQANSCARASDTLDTAHLRGGRSVHQEECCLSESVGRKSSDVTAKHIEPPPGLSPATGSKSCPRQDRKDTLAVNAEESDSSDDGLDVPMNDKCEVCGVKSNTENLGRCVTCDTCVCALHLVGNSQCTACASCAKHEVSQSILLTMRLQGGLLAEWSRDHYQGDTFHSTATKELRRKMKYIPEEYYTLCGRPVLRPNNVHQFLTLHKQWIKEHGPIQVDFIEIFSGSARLSAAAEKSGLKVGPPIDFRYGWDLRLSSHRVLLTQALELLKPKIIFWSPECRSWSRSANKMDPLRKAALRHCEVPLLTWLVRTCRSQLSGGFGIVVEQPNSADSWKLSPLAILEKLPGVIRRRVSQCMHGAIHPEQKLPVRKDTCFATNLRFRHTVKVCSGGHRHAPLQGRCARTGLCLTTHAATYPRPLVRCLVKDILLYVHDHEYTDKNAEQVMLANQQVALWACPKCNLGPNAAPGVQHTRIQGECRQYGQPTRPRRIVPPSPGVAAAPTDAQRAAVREQLHDPAPLPYSDGSTRFLPRPTSLLKRYRGKETKTSESSSSTAAPTAPTEAPHPSHEEAEEPAAGSRENPYADGPTGSSSSRAAPKTPEHTPQPKIPAATPAAPNPGPELDSTQRPAPTTLRGLRMNIRTLLECDWPSVEFNKKVLWLHERLWHCPPAKLRKLLTQAGVPRERLANLEDVMKLCRRCQEFKRPQNRPQVSITLASRFGQCLQLDYCSVLGSTFLIMVDELFRYVQARKVLTYDAQEAANVLLQTWLRYFGNPETIKCDQGTTLASAELGAILERWSIQRELSGADAPEHTMTGLVEKHVELFRLAMAKLHADLQEQGVTDLPHDDLAAEVCGALNNLLLFHGVCPIAGVTGNSGTLDLCDMSEATPLDGVASDMAERAIVLRHNARIAVTRATLEQRVARAAHTRPQPTHVTHAGQLVDLFKRAATKDLPGWRGPGVVLEVTPDRGTATVRWQGRPWLMSLRHLRPHEGYAAAVATSGETSAYWAYAMSKPHPLTDVRVCFQDRTSSVLAPLLADGYPLGDPVDLNTPQHQTTTTDTYESVAQAVQSLQLLQDRADGCAPGKVQTYGRLYDGHSWKHVASVPVLASAIEKEADAVCARLLNNSQYHLLRFGTQCKAVPSLPVKAHTRLITWHRNNRLDYSIQDIGIPASTKVRLTRSDCSFIALSSYEFPSEDDELLDPDPVDADILENPGTEPDEDMPRPDDEMASEPSVSRTTTYDTDLPEIPEVPQSPDKSIKSSRPSTPESSMGQPAASSSAGPVLPLAESQDDTSSDTTSESETLAYFTSVFSTEVNNAIHAFESQMKDDVSPPTWFSYYSAGEVRQSLQGEVFRVDVDTDNLTAAEVETHVKEVKAADLKEVKSFVDHEVWQPVPLTQAGRNVISCTWVRKWKRKDSDRLVKSRLCCRGFLDKQKSELFKYASTASRLSQKMLVSNAVLHGWSIESWDVSTAFLRGLSFQEIERIAQELRVPSPLCQRTVYVQVPGNVWKHLRDLNAISQSQYALACSGKLCLQLKKAMYGLCDAPALWQLALMHHLQKQMHGEPSCYDACHYYFRSSDRSLTGEGTAHVDDTCFSGPQTHLDKQRKSLESRFGAVSRQTLPFQHVGVQYERTPKGGIRMQQTDFCKALKVVNVPRGTSSDRPLTPPELTSLRAVLGALLFLGYTRADLAADIILLASKINKATVGELRAANAVVRRAQAAPHLGLVYEPLRQPLVVLSLSDASFSTSSTAYAVEGVTILLSSAQFMRCLVPARTQYTASVMNGFAHLLVAGSHKAKRISHSTSHAESLACYNALGSAEVLAARLTEAWWRGAKPLSLEQLLTVEDLGLFEVPILALTDCMDLLELIVGSRGVPQDKSQRLIVLSLRERRVLRKTRAHAHIDTNDMLANGLTKHVAHNPQLTKLLSTGELHFSNRAMRLLTAPVTAQAYDEASLMRG